jgi:hypothetical protein
LDCEDYEQKNRDSWEQMLRSVKNWNKMDTTRNGDILTNLGIFATLMLKEEGNRDNGVTSPKNECRADPHI